MDARKALNCLSVVILLEGGAMGVVPTATVGGKAGAEVMKGVAVGLMGMGLGHEPDVPAETFAQGADVCSPIRL